MSVAILVSCESVPLGGPFGEQKYLWRAVDEHGQVLDILLQDHRDTDAAERFFRALLGHADAPPERIVTDRLGSYGAAAAEYRTTLAVRFRSWSEITGVVCA